MVGSCIHKPPVFHVDTASFTSCENQSSGDHTITVDDFGGVGAGDLCVAISLNKKHHVEWKASSPGNRVSITFILKRGQKKPFEEMSCGPEDHSTGAKLCTLLACPDHCKTKFRSDYSTTVSEYFYYSPGTTSDPPDTGKSGGDAGIRIDP